MDSGKFWILNVDIFSMQNVLFPWPEQDKYKPNIEKKNNYSLFRLLSQYRFGHCIKNSRVRQFHETRAQMVIVFHWMEISRLFFGCEEKHIIYRTDPNLDGGDAFVFIVWSMLHWSTHETHIHAVSSQKHGSVHVRKLPLWLRVAPMRLVKWWIIVIMNNEQNLVCEMLTRNCWANLHAITLKLIWVRRWSGIFFGTPSEMQRPPVLPQFDTPLVLLLCSIFICWGDLLHA